MWGDEREQNNYDYMMPTIHDDAPDETIEILSRRRRATSLRVE
jgi:hypothetical protein